MRCCCGLRQTDHAIDCLLLREDRPPLQIIVACLWKRSFATGAIYSHDLLPIVLQRLKTSPVIQVVLSSGWEPPIYKTWKGPSMYESILKFLCRSGNICCKSLNAHHPLHWKKRKIQVRVLPKIDWSVSTDFAKSASFKPRSEKYLPDYENVTPATAGRHAERLNKVNRLQQASVNPDLFQNWRYEWFLTFFFVL